MDGAGAPGAQASSRQLADLQPLAGAAAVDAETVPAVLLGVSGNGLVAEGLAQETGGLGQIALPETHRVETPDLVPFRDGALPPRRGLPGSGRLGEGDLEAVRVPQAQRLLAETVLRSVVIHPVLLQPFGPEGEAPLGHREAHLDRQPRAFASRGHLRPREERQVRARVPLGVGIEEVVRVRNVLVDGPLDQPETEHARVEVQVFLGVSGDDGDVMDTVNGAHGGSPPGGSEGRKKHTVKARRWPPGLGCRARARERRARRRRGRRGARASSSQGPWSLPERR